MGDVGFHPEAGAVVLTRPGTSGAPAFTLPPVDAPPSTPQTHHPAGSALAVAAAAIAAQAKALGTPLVAPPAAVEHHWPSAALGDLLARRQLAPTPEQDHAFAELDPLPAPLRLSLTRVIDAFVASEEATAVAFANADLDERARQMDRLAEPPADRRTSAGAEAGDALRQAGIDLSPLLAARLVLLDAAATPRTSSWWSTWVAGTPTTTTPGAASTGRFQLSSTGTALPWLTCTAKTTGTSAAYLAPMAVA